LSKNDSASRQRGSNAAIAVSARSTRRRIFGSICWPGIGGSPPRLVDVSVPNGVHLRVEPDVDLALLAAAVAERLAVAGDQAHELSERARA
jgi:hypothetical protein